MKKKSGIIIALLVSTLFFDLKSQDIILDVNTGAALSSSVRFNWSSRLTDNSSGSTDRGNLYTIGVSGQLYKFFYIRTEIGANALNHLLRFEYEPGTAINSGGGSIFGWYRAEYFYWALLPEVRFFKNGLLYGNIGFASYNNISSVFNDVVSNRNIGDTYRGNSTAWVANVGVNPKWNGIGLVLNIGFHSISPTSRNAGYIPEIGFSQWHLKFGVSYDLK